MLKTELSTVGALRGPFCQPWPIDVSRLSSPPVARLWHELHENTPDADRRGSKNSALPRAIFSGVMTLSFTEGTVDGRGLNISSAALRRSSSAADTLPTTQSAASALALRRRNNLLIGASIGDAPLVPSFAARFLVIDQSAPPDTLLSD